jgi:hypothetical protein
MRWVRIAMVGLVVMPAAGCGSSGSGAGGGNISTSSTPVATSSTTADGASSTAVSTSPGPSTASTTSTSAVPPARSTNGPVAVWDICGVAGAMQVVDPRSGARITTVGLRGRPSWSPDGRRIATVDHFDGKVKVADVAAGTIGVVADLHLGPYHTGDSCGTFAKVGWSADGTSLLLQYGGSYGAEFVVRVLRVDGSGDRILFEQPQVPGGTQSLVARWLPNGEVMIAYSASDSEGDIVVQRGDPWGSWPPPPMHVRRPNFPHVWSPSISPTGDRIALEVMGDIPTDGCSAATACTGGVVMVELPDGSARTVSTHRPEGPVTFSPDGSQVASVEYDYSLGYPAILVLTKVDGSGERIIHGMKGGNSPSWSPDGRSVVVGGFAVRRADLDSGAVKELVPQPSGGTEVPAEFAPDWGTRAGTT